MAHTPIGDDRRMLIARRRMVELLGSSLALAIGGIPADAGSSARGTTEPGGPAQASGTRPTGGGELSTRLTREYGVRYPFVGAGMGFVAMADLVAAVSNAGGIGVIGAAPEPPAGVASLIRAVRAKTDRLFGVDLIVDTTAFGPATTDDHIGVCVAEKVQLVVFHWNPPPPPWVEELHRAGARVWMQTGLLDQALEAVKVGVDGIVAQGHQAGGHVKSRTPTIPTLRRLLQAVPSSLVVLAAGGISTGRSAAEALVNGAHGVWVGTRLIASAEAHAHQEYKRRLVAATGEATAITTIFGPEWPRQSMRVLRNRVVREWAGRETEIPSPPPPPTLIGRSRLTPNAVPGGVPYEMPKFSAMVPTPDTTGDFEEMCLPAGEAVTTIREIKPAAEIVVEMMEEARAILETTTTS